MLFPFLFPLSLLPFLFSLCLFLFPIPFPFSFFLSFSLFPFPFPFPLHQGWQRAEPARRASRAGQDEPSRAKDFKLASRASGQSWLCRLNIQLKLFLAETHEMYVTRIGSASRPSEPRRFHSEPS